MYQEDNCVLDPEGPVYCRTNSILFRENGLGASDIVILKRVKVFTKAVKKCKVFTKAR